MSNSDLVTGKIIKGVGGFYYVYNQEAGTVVCRARGAFRKEGLKPLVGDDVEIRLTFREEVEGNVERILPRRNALVRPAVANVDQALVIFAAASPSPNFNLLDRFLAAMAYRQVPAVLCFNKADLAEQEDMERLRDIYENAGCAVLFSSARTGEGVDALRRVLSGRTTTVAGPSGVGKSSLINLLQPHAQMETGHISGKIQRGRHTTRHSQLIPLDEDTFIMDTPGFSSLYLDELTEQELRDCYPEFAPYEGTCRFQGCLHLAEPDCPVKEAVENGRISAIRYENYVQLQGELRAKRRKP